MLYRIVPASVLAVATALTVVSVAVADPPLSESEAAQAYAECMAFLPDQPEVSLEKAEELWKRGAVSASRHCVGGALIAMGRHEEGAKVLSNLAEDLPPDQLDLKPMLLGQAGQAWLMADAPVRAEDVLGQALALAPDDAELRTDRAAARGAMGEYWDAIDDLNHAIEVQPAFARAWVYRATAYRLLDVPELAVENADEALRLDPHSPDAWLERGILYHLAKDMPNAREAWRRTVELDPHGPAGRDAQTNLAHLKARDGAADR